MWKKKMCLKKQADIKEQGVFPEYNTAGFPLQLQASILRCFMHLFSLSIKPGNSSQFAAPRLQKDCQSDTYTSFLLLSMVLSAFFHCLDVNVDSFWRGHVHQILHLEEYALYVFFFSIQGGCAGVSTCFLCLLINSPHFPSFIGLHIHITSKFTTHSVFHVC